MSGTVGIIANDNARYTLFAIRLTQMRTPVNTKLDWALTSDRILGRNTLAERALERGAEWILFIDDDHVFPDDILLRLLAHDLPVVGALYLQRMVPFFPVAYAAKNEDDVYLPIDLTKAPSEGLMEVAALGTGGMLIRSEVLRAMPFPWFEHGRASEDLIFCDKVNELELGPIHVDLGIRLGHMAPSSLWPTHTEEEGWSIGFSVADNFSIKVAISAPGEAEEEDE